MLQIGGGAGSLGLVFASFTIGRAAFILVGGVWADRLPRRVVMLTCDLLRAAIQAATCVALLTDVMEVWMFVASSFVVGAAHAFFGPASTGLVPETVSTERLQQANALLSLSRSGIEIFGPATAGVIVAAGQPAWVFAVDAVSFLASAVFLAVLPIARREVPVRQRFLADLADGCREAWSRGWLRAGFLLAGVANVGLGVFFVLGPVIAERELGGAGDWGLAMSIAGVGGFLGSLIALRWHPQRPLVATFVVWSFGALPPLSLINPLPAVVVGVLAGVWLAGISIGTALWQATVQEQIPNEKLARVDSYDWLISLVFMPLGFAVAGSLAAGIGIDTTLAIAGAVSAFAHLAVLAVPSLRAIRRGPAVAAA